MKLELIFIAHLFSCFAMTGLILLIQLVHYPTFKYIDVSSFKQFNLFHQRNISFIVMPLMLIELGTGILLTFYLPHKIFVINLILNTVIFLSTAFLSVPLHKKLLMTKSSTFIEKLVLTNWIRTFAWTVRSLILLSILIASLQQVVVS